MVSCGSNVGSVLTTMRFSLHSALTALGRTLDHGKKKGGVERTRWIWDSKSR